MRAFFALLILMICFSGYSAAAHSFEVGSCSSSSESTMKGDGDCANHHKAEKKDTGDKTGKSTCLDCTHCCSAHVASFSGEQIKLHVADATLGFPPLQTLKSQNFSSLLRPPKTLA